MRHKKRILFICGSINQTTQMHQIAFELSQHTCLFTPFYSDGFEYWLQRMGIAETTINGHKLRNRCLDYLCSHRLTVDLEGQTQNYDLVVTCTDLIIQKNIRKYPLLVVQEGMTDPEGITSQIVKRLPFLPRWMASTSMTSISNQYDRFCVASEGYRRLFVQKGADPKRIVVTGIPNFDNCESFYENTFPFHDYLLVCTSDMRETLRFERRKRFIKRTVELANGRRIIYKLHPNENHRRAIREIQKYAKGALIFINGPVGQMIANCSVLVTQYSSVTYIGLALNKEVHTYLDLDELRDVMPIQNHGMSAQNIAEVCEMTMNAQKIYPLYQSGRHLQEAFV